MHKGTPSDPFLCVGFTPLIFAMHYTPLLLALLLWSGCRPTDAPPLVADYLVRYQEASASLRLQAKYKQKQGDQYIEYQPSTGLQALGHAFRYKDRQGLDDNVYVLERQQSWAGQYDFQFRLPNGELIAQTVAFAPMREVRLTTDSITLAQGFTLAWEGQPLQAQQKLQLLFSAPDLPDVSLIKVGASGGTSLILRAEQLTRLRAGHTYTLQLVHTHYTPFGEDAPVSGAATVEYFYAPIRVTVVP